MTFKTGEFDTIDEVEMTTWIQEKMWKSYRVGHLNKARRGSFSSSSALWSCFKSNNVFSVIHLRSSLNGSKISALIRLPTIWSQQRHNGTKGRSIEIRSQFVSTPWFGSFQIRSQRSFSVFCFKCDKTLLGILDRWPGETAGTSVTQPRCRSRSVMRRLMTCTTTLKF